MSVSTVGTKTKTPSLRAEMREDKVLVSFPYDPDLVDIVRRAPRRRWEPVFKLWILPADAGSIPVLEELIEEADGMGFDTERARAVLEGLKEELEKRKNLSRAAKADLDVPTPQGLELLPFQKAGVAWLEERKGRALIADEMGLGKTVQVLGWLNLHPEKRPVVVICPASAKLVWKYEGERWLLKRKKIQVVKNGKDEIKKDADIVVISYDLVRKRLSDLKALRPQVVVLDESHYVKNYKAQRTKAALELARQAPCLIALTGTPILNRPIEVFTTLKALDSTSWGSWEYYVKRYCDGWKDERGWWHVDGASHLDELQERLRTTVMIRRLKKDVLSELPSKRRIFLPLEGKLTAEYKRIWKEFVKGGKTHLKTRAELLETEDPEAREKLKEALSKGGKILFEKVEQLRQEAFKAKFDTMIGHLIDLIESKNKVVVFAYHREAWEQIKEALEKQGFTVVGFLGGDSSEKRENAIEAFQEGDAHVFLTTVRAGAEAITLTAASTVAFAEVDWAPGKLIQAEDRVHRIGQAWPVEVYYYALQNSIEATIIRKILYKLDVIDKALDSQEGGSRPNAADQLDFFDLLAELLVGEGENEKGGMS